MSKAFRSMITLNIFRKYVKSMHQIGAFFWQHQIFKRWNRLTNLFSLIEKEVLIEKAFPLAYVYIFVLIHINVMANLTVY